MISTHCPAVIVQSDLNGTADDSEYQKRSTYCATIRKLFGIECGEAEFADVLGLSMRETCHALTNKFRGLSPVVDLAHEHLKLPIGEVIMRHRQQLDKEYAIKPRPGYSELLDSLDTLQVPCGIVTSARETTAHSFLNQIGFVGRFQDVTGIGSRTSDGRTAITEKPSPELYNISAERMNAQDALRISLEDSLPGVKAAVASRVHFSVYIFDYRVAPPHQEALRIASFSTSCMREAREYIADQVHKHG